jgi:phage terminase small subunit
MADTPKKSKGLKELDQKAVDHQVAPSKNDVTPVKKDERETMFVNLLVAGFSPHQAALKAGYSKSYASSGVYQKLKKSERLQTKIAAAAPRWSQNYRRFCRAALPEIAEIEANALGEYRKNPALAIDKPTLLKQLKQTADVLAPDAPQAPKINIQKLQIGQMMVAQNLTRGLSGSPDLEMLDVTPGTVESDPSEE